MRVLRSGGPGPGVSQQSAVTVQLRVAAAAAAARPILSVLSLPILCTDGEAEPAGVARAGGGTAAQIEALALSVHADVCREVLVPIATPAPGGGTMRLVAAESSAYLGIGGKLWDSTWCAVLSVFSAHPVGCIIDLQ
eukprot:SAG11_NODE_2732_length_3032_cov_1.784862_4_plen_136_part_01